MRQIDFFFFAPVLLILSVFFLSLFGWYHLYENRRVLGAATLIGALFVGWGGGWWLL